MNHYNKPKFVLMALNKGPLLDKLYLNEAGITSYKALQGSWQGVDEDCYLITYESSEGLDRLLRLAERHNQEAVLVCDEERNAFIYSGAGFRLITPIGVFREVPKEDALECQCYSIDKETNKYYLASW